MFFIVLYKIIINFADWKQSDGLSLVYAGRHRATTVCERKVRAAQSIPLPNIEAVRKGWVMQKKTTAPLENVRIQKCKNWRIQVLKME